MFAVYSYLTDWKNHAVHAVVGLILLLALFVAPLPAYARVIILIAVVAFNLARGQAGRINSVRDL